MRIDFNSFGEIWGTIKKNKLRTFLTGFAVSWGIFLLIILVSIGNGVRNGISSNFTSMSQNIVDIYPRRTSEVYKGLPKGRPIRFTAKDLQRLRNEFPEITLISPIAPASGVFSYKNQSGQFSAIGVTSDYAKINLDAKLTKGRFINELDERERRKSVVIPARMKEVLFGDEDPIGKFINMGDIVLQVVGVYKRGNNDSPPLLGPFSTIQAIFSGDVYIRQIAFAVRGLDTQEKNDAFEKKLRASFARHHNFDAEDMSAMSIWNHAADFIMFNGIMNGMILFLWIVGLASLMAGVVGVSNIMLITVKERTREFGIRKALGATPNSIITLVILESIIIMTVFGYIGMLMGIGLTELFNMALESGKQSSDVVLFRDPTVNTSIALMSTLVMIVAGLFAGYFPARNATKITPVEAMRAD